MNEQQYSQILQLDEKDSELIRATETITSIRHCLRELIENSLDAGAKIINIKITNAGLESIIVSDNGSGISGQDFSKICSEGATSKNNYQSSDDQIRHNFSGGRGRALVAISKIANLTIESSCDNSGSGYRLSFPQPSGERQIQSISRTKGTSVIVQNIFYAYPVRRHFLLQHRSYEFQFLDEVIAGFAISTKANITMNIDDRAATHVYSSNIIQRIQTVLGKEVSNSLSFGTIDMNEWSDGASATVYTTPINGDLNGRIYMSINERPVINMQIIRHIRNEWRNCNGNKWPVVCLLLKIPSREAYDFHQESPFIGVNFIDLEKMEVCLSKGLQELWKNSSSSSNKGISPETSPNLAMPRVKPTRPLCLLGLNNRSNLTTDLIIERYQKIKNYKIETGYRNVVIRQSSFANMEVIGQWNKAFIVTRLGPDIFAIDQHAACEATNFEKLKTTRTKMKQKLVKPVLLTVSSEDFESAKNNRKRCLELGFEYEIIPNSVKYSISKGNNDNIISYFHNVDKVNNEIILNDQEILQGINNVNNDDSANDTNKVNNYSSETSFETEKNKILVLAVPNDKSVATGVQDFQETLALLRDTPLSQPQTQGSRGQMAYRACHSSVRVGDTLSQKMMKSILDRMATSSLPWNCPHGRPTWCCMHTLDFSPTQYGKK